MISSLILIVLLANSAFSIIPNHFQFRGSLNQKRTNHKNNDISVITAFTSQYLDHFNSNVSGNFSQRYSYTEQFSLNRKTAFLYISDLGTFEKGVITDERNPIVKAAKKFGASLFSLEHRYYGLSKPTFEKFDSHNLRYLNSQQAIMDIISFIKHANVKFNMDPDVRWILWGSGYAGILAALARKWDPQVISGAVASSAPLAHLYDFWQYNDHVEQTISEEGSYLCHSRIKEGFAEIRSAMYTQEGRDLISDLFHLKPSLNETNLDFNDVQMFYLAIISPFQNLVQFNKNFGLSIVQICETIETNNWSNMEVVYQVFSYVSTTFTGSVQPLEISYQDYISKLGNTDPRNEQIDLRMWQYQVCTEFGWFYTTNTDEYSLFGAVVPSSLFVNQCSDIFPDAQLTATRIRDFTIEYHNFYGTANNYTGTNVVFTNGQNDPWSRLGKGKEFSDYSVVSYVIPGASYSNDFFPGDNINSEILKTHNIILENISHWLNGPKNTQVLESVTEPWTRPVWGDFVVRSQQIQTKRDNEAKFSPLSDDVPSRKVWPRSEFKKRKFRRSQRKSFKNPDMEEIPADRSPGYEEGTFRQKVDHFDNTNPSTFQQKYFKNSQWARKDGPNFLNIGGEGPEDNGWVLSEDSQLGKNAKKYGATVYDLEHRFYGDSTVGDNNDFTKLTSLQMLYDLAEFIQSVNYRTGTTNPWITFGGSYPGALSAWMRELFPELVIGAVASSAPVQAKTDFYEYFMVVENIYKTYDSDCAINIKNGFGELQQLFLTREGRQNLSDVFQLNIPFGENATDTDRHFFFTNLYGAFPENIKKEIPRICNQMTNSSNTALENIINVYYLPSDEENSVKENIDENNLDDENIDSVPEINFQNYIDNIKTSQERGPTAAADILWEWQLCNEFGYYQTADSGNGFFGSSFPVNYRVEACKQLFGLSFNRTTIDQNVDNTNYVYGGRDHFRGSNVVFINGDLDPWHALGLYHHSDPSVVSYLIEGGSHCQDMVDDQDDDVPGLKIARDLIDENIARWLGHSKSTTTVSN